MADNGHGRRRRRKKRRRVKGKVLKQTAWANGKRAKDVRDDG